MIGSDKIVDTIWLWWNDRFDRCDQRLGLNAAAGRVGLESSILRCYGTIIGIELKNHSGRIYIEGWALKGKQKGRIARSSGNVDMGNEVLPERVPAIAFEATAPAEVVRETNKAKIKPKKRIIVGKLDW